MQRIAIIGSSGSGKSTLALQLHTMLQLPVHHLDQYNWLPGWQARSYEEFAQAHTNLCTQQQWIIEGIYTRTFEERIQYADTVIFLDLPRTICLWRILKRTIRYYNKPTPSSAVGCPERFDLKFLNYVWNFNYLYKKEIVNLLEKNRINKTIFIFNNETSVATFLQSLKKRADQNNRLLNFTFLQ